MKQPCVSLLADGRNGTRMRNFWKYLDSGVRRNDGGELTHGKPERVNLRPLG